jgi:hypothetical protein
VLDFRIMHSPRAATDADAVARPLSIKQKRPARLCRPFCVKLARPAGFEPTTPWFVVGLVLLAIN